MTSKFAAKWKRSITKRYRRVRRTLGLPVADGMTEEQRTATRWHADGVENTLRYDYDLSPDDVVLDLGGYQGSWSAEIFARYQPTVHIFEPVEQHYRSIAERFRRNDRIKPYCCGLSGETRTTSLGIRNDSSGEWTNVDDVAECRLMAIDEFLIAHGLTEVALCKINIEGGEYDLLESLLRSGSIGRFRNLQIQFHAFVPNAAQRMEAIQRQLNSTHELTYQYRFVWENWRRREKAAA
jgi:FkbM family methyltransferase